MNKATLKKVVVWLNYFFIKEYAFMEGKNLAKIEGSGGKLKVFCFDGRKLGEIIMKKRKFGFF